MKTTLTPPPKTVVPGATNAAEKPTDAPKDALKKLVPFAPLPPSQRAKNLAHLAQLLRAPAPRLNGLEQQAKSVARQVVVYGTTAGTIWAANTAMQKFFGAEASFASQANIISLGSLLTRQLEPLSLWAASLILPEEAPHAPADGPGQGPEERAFRALLAHEKSEEKNLSPKLAEQLARFGANNWEFLSQSRVVLSALRAREGI